jgi:hypothetical protein
VVTEQRRPQGWSSILWLLWPKSRGWELELADLHPRTRQSPTRSCKGWPSSGPSTSNEFREVSLYLSFFMFGQYSRCVQQKPVPIKSLPSPDFARSFIADSCRTSI